MATINSTSANETLTGSAAGDSYVFSNGFGQDSIVDAGGTTDTVNLAAVTANLTINLTAGAGNEITDGTNTINWTGDIIERAFGGSGNDSITGNSSDNILTGSGGSDTISGGAGQDTINGGSGNDSLDGGDGYDAYVFDNNWGNDTITADSSGGFDTLDFRAVTSSMTINLTSGAGSEATDGTNTLEIAGDFIEQAQSGSGNDLITGTSQNNSFWGSAGNDTLIGGAGNDILDGNNDNDSLDGGDGSDRYVFGAGALGTATWGNDTIVDSSGNDEVYLVGVSNNLTINLNAGAGDEVTDGTNTVNWTGNVIETVTAGTGNDSITGTSAAEVLHGWNGNDTIIAGSGDDRILGGAGDDSLDGGDGSDRYQTGDNWGNDTITDSSGVDIIEISGILNYTVNLNASAGDEVSNSAGNTTANWTGNIIETAVTGSGNDSITGNSSNNNLTANAGNDTLDGKDGNDNLYGGDGNDTYIFSGTWGTDTIATTPTIGEVSGIDTLDFSAVSAGLTVNLVSGAGNEVTDGTNTVNWASDVIENVIGGSGADSITGNSQNNNLNSGGGNDTITAGAGNDTLTGGAGDDSLDGGDGNDTYIFGDAFGYDTIGDSSGTDTLDLSSTTVHWDIDLRAYNAASIVQGTNYIYRVWQTSTTVLENAYGGSANDSIHGNDANNYLSGGDGDDAFDGLKGNDTLIGGNGNDYITDGNDGTFILHDDSLSGGDGDDAISSGYGGDTIDGGAGNDSIWIGTNVTVGGETHLIDTSGIDTLSFGFSGVYPVADMYYNALTGQIKYGSNVVASWDANTTYFEKIVGFNGADTIISGTGNDSLYGAEGSDSLAGGDGNDILYGNYGGLQASVDAYEADTLDGGNGNDFLSGQGWHDSLIGGDGNDSLDGGVGNDTLDGGTGNDLYKFSYNDNYYDTDTLTDSSGIDTIDFSSNVWNHSMTINLTSSAGNEAYWTSNSTQNLNWSSSVIENVIGTISADSIQGSSSANDLDGYEGNDTLIGMGGNDTLKGGLGNDIYQFAEGDGQDVVIENDTTGGNSDKVLFDSSVAQSVVAIFQTGSGDLQIGYTDSAGDLITVQGFNTTAGKVERFELSSGYYMTDAEINQVISDMAAYATTNSVSFTSLDDVKNDAGLMAIVSGGFHT